MKNVTKQRLAGVSADGFYWDLLRRQMTQPIGLITSAYFRTPAEFEQRQSYFVKQLAIDHRTGDFTSAQTSYVLGRMSNMSRCIDGRSYFLSRYGDGWSHLDSNDEECATIPQLMHSAATDGIVTSGLSDEQAGKVLASLRDEHEGFAHPRRPTLITVNGKTYIRQVVDYTPVKLDDGLYWGTRIFTRAFTETGLDPKTWPWYAGLGPGRRAAWGPRHRHENVATRGFGHSIDAKYSMRMGGRENGMTRPWSSTTASRQSCQCCRFGTPDRSG